MSESSSRKLISPTGSVVALVLTACFFYGMFGVVRSHVTLPVEDYPVANPLIATAVTACLSTVFWMAVGFFQVTFKDQRLRKAAHKK